MPNARPWRTRRSSSSAASCAILVLLDEVLLELVDDQQRARHRLVGRGVAPVAGEVLHANQIAEAVAAALQLLVEALQHAEAELAIALDGDGAGVRQARGGVRLELDALLEVDEIQLDLVAGCTRARGW